MKLFTTLRQTLASFLGGTEKNVNQRYPHLSSPVVQVTPGEWFDRVTILEIKVHKLRGDKQAAALSQLTELRESVRGRHLQYLRQSEALLKNLVGFLLIANDKLWNIEDQIRALDAEIFPLDKRHLIDAPCGEHDATLADPVKAYLELARSVYVTNDERSKRKRQIDEYFQVPPEVKEYAEYGQATETSHEQ